MAGKHAILLLGYSDSIGLTFHFTRLAIALKSAGNHVVVLSSERKQYKELSNELDERGIPCYISYGLNNMFPLSIAKAVNDIRKTLEEEGPFDFILGGGIRDGLRLFLANKRVKANIKTLSVIGSLPKSAIGMKLAYLSYNHFYYSNITLCNYTRNMLQKVGVNPNKIFVIPLFAPDLEWFDNAKRVKLGLEEYELHDLTHPVIFYAASHYGHKGFKYYLLSASEVLRKFDATFIVGGKGPLTPSLKEMVRKLGIYRHVIFTGWISNYHMPYILSNIVDICISTSLIEQLPSYIMECMAAGKPIIATNVGGVPEIVTDGVNGYLVPPCDHKETAHRIIEMIEEPEKARKMGEAGRKMIEKQLNMRISASRLMKMMQEGLEQN